MKQPYTRQALDAALRHCGIAAGSRILLPFGGSESALAHICGATGAVGLACAGSGHALYPGGSFDAVLCLAPRLGPHETQALHEALFLLKPRGRLVVLCAGELPVFARFCRQQQRQPQVQALPKNQTLYLLQK